ncbi:hypothetical protein V6N12_033133 [Hibiscus sabdariffa]|uniref:Uncharacterized protein n=1 Tax=Hibiscus sabdariffa TaxID=183260 RepID=A0ABR2BDE4_9ROSI
MSQIRTRLMWLVRSALSPFDGATILDPRKDDSLSFKPASASIPNTTTQSKGLKDGGGWVTGGFGNGLQWRLEGLLWKWGLNDGCFWKLGPRQRTHGILNQTKRPSIFEC